MNRTEAHDRLVKAINDRTAGARETVERVLNVVPQDSIVRAEGLRFHYPSRADLGKEQAQGVLTMRAGPDGTWRLHPHALQQVSETAGVPYKYVQDLQAGEPWQKDMLAHLLSETYFHSKKKHLIRAVPVGGSRMEAGGRAYQLEARGFLSDRFRRLDTRPLLDTFIGEAQSLGALPFSGVASDTRAAIKAIMPNPLEVFEGEFVALGMEWGNSDFGGTAYSLRAFILRIVCINGAAAEDMLREVHLGGRLPDSIEFSQATYDADTKAMTLATKDVVRGALGPGGLERMVTGVREAATKEVNWNTVRERLSKALTKDELRRVDETYNGPDVTNLPPGNTVWRASNALSWIGQTIEDPDRRLDFERLAGAVLTGKKNGEAGLNN